MNLPLNLLGLSLAVALITGCAATDATSTRQAEGKSDALSPEANLESQQPPTADHVWNLIVVSGAAASFEVGLSNLLAQFKASYQSVPSDMWDALGDELAPSKVIPLAIPLYMERFTATEVDELIQFFGTPLGRKFADAGPWMVVEMAPRMNDFVAKAMRNVEQDFGFHFATDASVRSGSAPPDKSIGSSAPAAATLPPRAVSPAPQRSGGFLSWFRRGSLEDPIQLPLDEVAKLTATARADSAGSFIVSLYNGSDWNIVEIVVRISRKRESDSRQFRLSTWDVVTESSETGSLRVTGRKKSSAESLSNSSFRAAIGDFLAGDKKISDPEMRKTFESRGLNPDKYSLQPPARTDWSWTIEFVFGFRK